MDPLRPTTVYSNNIYSKEFYELVRSRLKPGGVLMSWINNAEQMNTIASVYPHVRQECSIYVIASDQPVAAWRDVESIIAAKLPAKTQAAIVERRKLCEPDRDLLYDPGMPILEDRNPVAEYHLGRFYQVWRLRNAP
jgi:hypothetical protein